MIHENVITGFSPETSLPEIADSAYVHPLSAVSGGVRLGERVLVAPFASIRGDEGQPLHIGDESNIQDAVVIHALETEKNSLPIRTNQVEYDGLFYAVYIGRRVSLAHQVQVHGPAFVDDDTFIGMKSLVFRSCVGTHCVIEPGCILMGVNIQAGRYVPAGSVLTSQQAADELPEITPDYPLATLNKDVVRVNTSLADSYNSSGPQKK